ncbi:hypothetical protein DFJ73DRAFT_874987 [Zopfochytrium polystomum]|nr:hypothetical protein DFJ73DRAFT_874987 [Zopfochytrium polystomum]
MSATQAPHLLTTAPASPTLFAINVGPDAVRFNLPASVFSAFQGTYLHDRTTRILQFSEPQTIDLPLCSAAVFRLIVLPFYDRAVSWELPDGCPALTALGGRPRGSWRLPSFASVPLLDRVIEAFTSPEEAVIGDDDGCGDNDSNNPDSDTSELTAACIDRDLRFLNIPSPFSVRWSFSLFATTAEGRSALARMQQMLEQIQRFQKAAIAQLQAELDTTAQHVDMLTQFADLWKNGDGVSTKTGWTGHTKLVLAPAALKAPVRRYFRLDELFGALSSRTRRYWKVVFMPQACRASEVPIQDRAACEAMSIISSIFGQQNIIFKRIDATTPSPFHGRCASCNEHGCDGPAVSQLGRSRFDLYGPKPAKYGNFIGPAGCDLEGDVSVLEPLAEKDNSATVYHDGSLSRVPQCVLDASYEGSTDPYVFCFNQFEDCIACGADNMEIPTYSSIGVALTLDKMPWKYDNCSCPLSLHLTRTVDNSEKTPR